LARAIFWPPIKKLLVIKTPEETGEWGLDVLKAEGLRVGLRKAKARNRLACSRATGKARSACLHTHQLLDGQSYAAERRNLLFN